MRYQNTMSRVRHQPRPSLLDALLKARAAAHPTKDGPVPLPSNDSSPSLSDRETVTATPLDYQEGLFSDMQNPERQAHVNTAYNYDSPGKPGIIKHSLKTDHKRGSGKSSDRTVIATQVELPSNLATTESSFMPPQHHQKDVSHAPGGDLLLLKSQLAVEGDLEYRSLTTWFMALAPEQLPQPPFQLKQGHTVMGPLFYVRLKEEIERGPKSARAMTGALQADLQALQKIMV